MIPDTPVNPKDLHHLQQELLRTRNELSRLSPDGDCKKPCRNYAYIVENAPVSVVITEANGRAVESAEDLVAQVSRVDEGGYLRLYVYRPRFDRSFFAILKLDE